MEALPADKEPNREQALPRDGGTGNRGRDVEAPFLYQLGSEGARKVLDDIQAAPIDMPKVEEKETVAPTLSAIAYWAGWSADEYYASTMA